MAKFRKMDISRLMLDTDKQNLLKKIQEEFDGIWDIEKTLQKKVDRIELKKEQ